MADKNGSASIAGSSTCVSKHTPARRAVLKAFAYIIPKQEIKRPRSSNLVGVGIVSAKGDNYRNSPPITSQFAGFLTATGICRKTATVNEFEFTGTITALAGKRKDQTASLMGVAAFSGGTASRAGNRSALLTIKTTFKAFWSRLSPPVRPMIGKMKASGKAFRQANAAASISGQPLSMNILAGVPRPGFANLFSEFFDILVDEAGAHRPRTAFPTISSASVTSAVAKRRAKADPFVIGSTCTAIYNVVQFGWLKPSAAKSLVSSSAVVVRDALAWLPAHKTKMTVKAMRSPSASLVGLGAVHQFWPDVIRSVSASISAGSNTLLSIAFGIPPASFSATSTFTSSAVAHRVASAILADQEGELVCSGNKADVVFSEIAASSSLAAIPVFIEGPKATFAFASTCDCFGERWGLGFSRMVAKAVSEQTAASNRARRANVKAHSSSTALGGGLKERQVSIEIESSMFAGWGGKAEIVTIDVVS